MTDILTTIQAGEIAGVNGATVNKWILDGALPATRTGRVWAIARADLEAYLPTHAARIAGIMAEGRRTWEQNKPILPSSPPPATKLPPHSLPAVAETKADRRKAICAECGRECVLVGVVCFDCNGGRGAKR